MSLARYLRAKRRIITETTADNFHALFDPCAQTNSDDVDGLLSYFNSHCGFILEKVAPLKVNIAPRNSLVPGSMKMCLTLGDYAVKLSAFGKPQSWPQTQTAS